MIATRLGWWALLWLVAVTPSLSGEEPFPEAKALVKQWNVVWSVEPWAERAVVKVTKDILVRDPLGTDASNQVIAYYATKTELSKFDAKTIHADGQETPVTEGLKHERPLLRSGNIEYRALQFTFPDVQPGSTLHYEYELRLSELRYALPIDGGWWELQGELPVLEAKVTTRVKDDHEQWEPRTATVVPFDSWCTAGDVKDFGYFSYEIKCENVPAFQSEPMAPPDTELRARVFVYAWPKHERDKNTLNSVAAHWGRAIAIQLETSKKLSEVAAQWANSELTPTQQLGEIVKWVRNNIALTSEGSESLDEVLERKSGTGNERNLLALGLMRQAKIVARPAILCDRTSKAYHPEVPDVSQLDHLFIAVGKPELAKYLDVNCEHCVPGVPPWQYIGPGGGGVVLDLASSATIMLSGLFAGMSSDPSIISAKTDALPAKYNSEIRKRTITLEPTGAAQVKGSITWQMQQDVDKRELWNAMTPAGRRQDCIGYLPVEVEDAAVTTGDPKNTEDYLTCAYEFRVPDAAFRLEARLLVPGVDDFTAAIDLPIQTERHYPVLWRYARSVQSDVTYKLPPGSVIATLPEPTTLKGPEGISFQAHWLRTDQENEIRLRGLLLVDTPLLSPADFAATRSFIAAVRSYLSNGVELEDGP